MATAVMITATIIMVIMIMIMIMAIMATRTTSTEEPMIGNYVLHHPLTDFAVGLLVIAALLEIGRLGLKRPQWQIAVDLLLFLGFGGAIVAVGSGLWLVAVQDHGDSKTLSNHHWFAYTTLGAAAVAVLAHFLARSRPKLAALKTGALLLSAATVSGAGFFGGTMAHPPGERAAHMHGDESTPASPETAPHGHDASDLKPTAEPNPNTDSKPAAEPEPATHTEHQPANPSEKSTTSGDPKPASPQPKPAVHDHQH